MDTHTASRQVLRGSAAHRSRAETALDTHTAWEALLPQCTAHLFKGVRSMLGATPGMPVSALPGRAAAARGRQRPARRGQALRRSTEGAPRQRHDVVRERRTVRHEHLAAIPCRSSGVVCAHLINSLAST